MVPASAGALSADLRKRIEIMAEHIARNGPEFESTVRQKNVNNPQFAFLYNGEGADYYNHVLTGHRGNGHSAQPAAGGAVRPAAAAGPQAGNGANGLDFTELLRRWREPPVYPLAPEMERQLVEVVASLEAMASRDAIRNGRAWIECNSALAPQIAGHLMKRVGLLQTCGHRLHVLYLVHDVLQTEAARKEGGKPLIRAFKPYLVWIMRPAYRLAHAASSNGEESARVLRLLQLWVERGILEPHEAEEMKALVTPVELPGAGGVQGQSLAALQQSSRPGAGLGQTAPGVGLGQMGARPPAGMMGARPGAMHHPMVRHQGLAGVGMPYGSPLVGHANMMAGRPLAAGMVPGQMHMPMMPGPRLQGYRPLIVPGMAGKQTPETVPVGVLATMMMHAVRRVGRANFVPYRPLDTAHTPQMLPPMEVPTQRLLERVEDFYADLKEEEQSSRSSSRSSSHSHSRSCSGSRSRSRSRGANAAGAAGLQLGGGMLSAVPPPAID